MTEPQRCPERWGNVTPNCCGATQILPRMVHQVGLARVAGFTSFLLIAGSALLGHFTDAKAKVRDDYIVALGRELPGHSILIFETAASFYWPPWSAS